MSDRLTRRSFLHAPAVAVAVPAVLSSQSPGSELRVAFVGVGNRGSHLLRQMLQVPGVRVVATCDIVPERARAAAEEVAKAGGKADTYTDYRKMLDERKDIDAVVAATPDYTHRDVYPAILEVGRHLYGEKPLALNAADGKMIVAAAKQAKGRFQVGFQLRHDPARNAAEKFIHSGGIGKVLFCQGIRHGGDLPRNIPWYFDKEKSGDIVVDQGIHILDLFTWAMGDHPRRVLGSGGTNLFINEPPGRTVMDNYSLIYEYPGDRRVNFSHHYFDPPGFTGIRELVFGSKGSIDLVTATWQPRDSRQKIKLDVPNAGKDSSYMALAAFVDSVKNGSPVMSDADSGLISTLVPIMGTKAIYEKRPVTWEEVAG
jgi:myo-inositol 2-dehydrogenase / D-chiro-inositol 1-dehydrogenase